ncbi:hypothetical protein BDV3_006392 [Batrachochytrium dendrobatidis]
MNGNHDHNEDIRVPEQLLIHQSRSSLVSAPLHRSVSSNSLHLHSSTTASLPLTGSCTQLDSLVLPQGESIAMPAVAHTVKDEQLHSTANTLASGYTNAHHIQSCPLSSTLVATCSCHTSIAKNISPIDKNATLNSNAHIPSHKPQFSNHLNSNTTRQQPFANVTVENGFISTGSILWSPVNSILRSISSLFSSSTTESATSDAADLVATSNRSINYNHALTLEPNRVHSPLSSIVYPNPSNAISSQSSFSSWFSNHHSMTSTYVFDVFSNPPFGSAANSTVNRDSLLDLTPTKRQNSGSNRLVTRRNTLSSAEYYGVDFGPPTKIQPLKISMCAKNELIGTAHTSAYGSIHSMLSNPWENAASESQVNIQSPTSIFTQDHSASVPIMTINTATSSTAPEPETKQRCEQGSIFISALSTLMQSRAFSSITSQAGIDSNVPLLSGERISSATNKDTLDLKEGHHENDVQSETNSQYRVSAVKQLEQYRHQRIGVDELHFSDLRNSIISASSLSTQSLHQSATIQSAMTPTIGAGGHKWLSPAQERQQTLDYSDVFPKHVGRDCGITVFRIEALTPAIQSQELLGRFCVADCYIILVTAYVDSAENTFDEHREGYEHRIYTWIGGDAEMDKKFCAAMFSVGLRNWVGAACRIEREVEGEESPEFLAEFGDEIEYEDSSQATESGLFMAEQKRYPLRLYKMHGKTGLRLCLVETLFSSLKSDGVFLLDWGLEIFQWNGSASNMHHRVKCRMICDRINTLERVGRAHVVVVDEGDEPFRLWEILGGERVPPVLENSCSGTKPVQQESQFDVLAKAPSILYRVFPKIAPQLESHQVATGDISRSLLVSDGCYILDVGVELFLWLGKNAWPQLRSMATELLARVASSRARPKWVGLTRCIDQHEPEIFKLKFCDWDGFSLHYVDWRDVSDGSTPRPGKRQVKTLHKSKITADVKALYGPPPTIDFNPLLVQDTIEHANHLLQAFTCFVYNRGRFVQLPECERGHFFSHDAYVFLCVYRVEEREELADQLASKRMSTKREPDTEYNTSDDGSPVSQSPHLFDGKYNFVDGSGNGLVLQNSTDSHANFNQGSQQDASEAQTPTDYSDTESACGKLPPVLECVVYFWQGKHSSRLAYSTFKLKTQHEMEHLVDQMYHSPVRVVHLEQGKEPVALLAHLDNMCIVRTGSRSDWILQLEARTAQSTMHQQPGYTDASGKQAAQPKTLHLSKSLSETSKSTTSKSEVETSALFHIRSDLRYGTSRAIQVRSLCSSLVSRDCFFLQSLDFSLCPRSYLWVGKGATREDTHRAKIVAEQIMSLQEQYDTVTTSPVTDNMSSASMSMTSGMGIYHGSNSNHSAKFDVIGEKLEPKLFWSLLPGGRRPYASGFAPMLQSIAPSSRPAQIPSHLSVSQHYQQLPLPRFLTCSCSPGYFLVEEIPLFSQSDCLSTHCVILDPGSTSRLFVWIGTEVSDVVRKLTRKSVEVWLRRLDDGRVVGFDDQDTDMPNHSSDVSQVVVSGDVVWICQGKEPIEFKAFFHGWDEYNSRINPGNLFLRQQFDLQQNASIRSSSGATTLATTESTTSTNVNKTDNNQSDSMVHTEKESSS